MIKLYGADGKVKKEFPGSVSVQYIGTRARLWSATQVVAEVKLQDGEMLRDE